MALRQFDVFENPAVGARGFAPYLVVLSSHLVPGLEDVIVAPLVNDAIHRLRQLELHMEVEGIELTLVISELSTMRARELRRRVASVRDREFEIRRALDRLFTGF